MVTGKPLDPFGSEGREEASALMSTGQGRIPPRRRLAGLHPYVAGGRVSDRRGLFVIGGDPSTADRLHETASPGLT